MPLKFRTPTNVIATLRAEHTLSSREREKLAMLLHGRWYQKLWYYLFR